jgi:sigma-B regulation protein RsbU (phosphoserine phosphatase)
MFSGILHSHMEQGGSVEELIARLNRSLWDTMPKHTLISFLLGQLDISTGQMTLSDCGCPFPYHFQAARGTVVEIPLSSYPLGVERNLTPSVAEIRLSPGDYVVFCSDGIPEVTGEDGKQFGYERTEETITQACRDGMRAEQLIDRVLGEAVGIRKGQPLEDDMTCVVVRAMPS